MKLPRRGSLAAASLLVLAASAPAQSAAGHCLSFDDLDDFVHVPRSVALEPSEITIEMWARLDKPQDWNSRLLRKGEYAAYFITADMDFDKRMQILVAKNQPGVRISAKDTQQHDAYIGTWHHFLGIYTAGHAEFWVDGGHRSTVPHALGPLTHDPLTDLYIGAGLPVTMPNEYFGGRIDEVRIWNYPRTPAEIAATWNRTVTGNEPGLVARWSFDEGAGQVAHDTSGFEHDGQLGWTPDPESSDPTWHVSEAPILPGGCPVTPYCIAAINSTGNGAHIGWLGSTSIAQNDSVLTVTGCPPKKIGIFFMGSYQHQIPFGEGYLCLTGNMHRLAPAVLTDSAGAGSLALDFGDPASPLALIKPGSAWNLQFWYRDPRAAAGRGVQPSAVAAVAMRIAQTASSAVSVIGSLVPRLAPRPRPHSTGRAAAIIAELRRNPRPRTQSTSRERGAIRTLLRTPLDVAARDLADGCVATLASRRGEVLVMVQATEQSPRGTLFCPFSFSEAPIDPPTGSRISTFLLARSCTLPAARSPRGAEQEARDARGAPQARET